MLLALAVIATVVLFILKVLAIATISWWLVFAPVLVWLVFFIVAAFGVIVGVVSAYKQIGKSALNGGRR